jgi:hypothetical protein
LSPLADTLRPLETPWTEVRRIFRRICLLRSRGRGGEAQRLEDTELAVAATQARGASASEPEADARMKALWAEEKERVAEAVAFAEILAPMLSERLSAVAPVRRPARAPAPERLEAGAPGEAHGIADYIDQMLAQDRADSS